MGKPFFTLHDELSNVEYNADSVAVYKAAKNGSEAYEGDSITDAVSLNSEGTTSYTGGKQQVAFDIDYDKLGEGTYYIVYTAKVKDDIVKTQVDGHYEGENSAYLTYWTNAAGDTSQTNKVSATVYTFALQLAKTNLDSDALTGAKYTFHTGGDTKDASNPLKFKQLSDDIYVVSDDDDAVSEIAAAAGAGENQLEIRGIDASKKYFVEETTVPNGYYKPQSSYTLELQSLKQNGNNTEHTGNLGNPATANPTFGCLTADSEADFQLIKETAADHAVCKITLANSATPSLPTTGGMGTIVLTVAGVVLMIAAGAFFVFRRRNQR